MFETIDSTIASLDARHAALTVGIGLTVWAAATDLKRFVIPNRVVALIALAGAVYVLVAELPAIPHVLSLLVVLALGFAAYSAGLFGAGDAKLLAVLSLWLGPVGAGGLILLTALFGAVLAFIWLSSRPLRHALIGAGLAIDPEPPKRVPYGVAIAAAALVAFVMHWP